MEKGRVAQEWSSGGQNSPSLSCQLNLLPYEGNQTFPPHPYLHRRAGGRRQQESERLGRRKQRHRVRKYTEFAVFWEDVDERGFRD